MKRSVLTILILSLFAVPLFAGSASVQKSERATNARLLSLEHVERAWRMQIRCDEGAGAIVLTDGGEKTVYRGEGCFAGWSQEQMSVTYKSLIPKDNSPAFELMQLG